MKINKKRLNKLLNTAVLIISIPLLIYGTSIFTQYDNISHTYGEEIGKCGDWSGYAYDSCISIWKDYFNDSIKTMNVSLTIGIGLPIVYFGGKKLIKYLTTED